MIMLKGLAYMHNRTLLALAALVALLVGCGQPAAPPAAGGTLPATGLPAPSTIAPVYAFSEAVAGKNRIAIGLVSNNTPLNDPAAKVHLRFFNLDEAGTQVKFESDAIYYGQGLPAAFYVAYPTFDKPGNWGIEIQVQLPGQAQPIVSKQRLEVKPSSEVPSIGQPAIVADPAMYQISLDQALKNGKPTALLFATPAFCRTATCGPSLEVLQGLQKIYGSKVNFIHVEVYKYPFDQSVQAQEQAAAQASQENRALTPEQAAAGLADAMVAWKLQSEPWLFLIDAQGTIAARYEGGLTKEELGPAIEKLIAGQPVF
jgi:hypothetical protein